VVGGGEVISVLDKTNILGTIDYVSTGGGAMLEFLAGEELPGIKALG
jgi:phosphoglycerate kinase